MFFRVLVYHKMNAEKGTEVVAYFETSLAIQWLRLHSSNAGGASLIPGWGTKTLHAAQHGTAPPPKKKREKLAYFKYLQQVQIERLPHPIPPPPLLNFWGCFTSLELVSKVYIQDPQGVADS